MTGTAEGPRQGLPIDPGAVSGSASGIPANDTHGISAHEDLAAVLDSCQVLAERVTVWSRGFNYQHQGDDPCES